MFLLVSSRQLLVPLRPINLVKTYLDSCANTNFLSGLHNCLEFCQTYPLLFISGYANTENVFYCLIFLALQCIPHTNKFSESVVISA